MIHVGFARQPAVDPQPGQSFDRIDMKLSVRSDYASRAVLELARVYGNGHSRKVSDLAETSGLPANYLVQILIDLKGKGIVRSIRGRHGGYILAKSPDELTFGDVLRAMDGVLIDSPAISDGRCPEELRSVWRQLRDKTQASADSVKFSQILAMSGTNGEMYFI